MNMFKLENKILKELEGRRTRKQYSIKYATAEHLEEITRCMVEYFLKEEPTCKYLKCYEDERLIEELKIVWKQCIEMNLGIVCLTNGSKPQMAGFVLLSKANLLKDRKGKHDFQNDKWNKVKGICEYVRIESNIHDILKLEEYLTDIALLVVPDFRGDGLAEELLNACDYVCEEHKLSAIAMTFSSYVSQYLAKKLGWQELYSMPFEEFRKIDMEKYGIENIEEHTKDFKFMCKVL